MKIKSKKSSQFALYTGIFILNKSKNYCPRAEKYFLETISIPMYSETKIRYKSLEMNFSKDNYVY